MKYNLFTIGFTKKSAEQFFDILKKNNINVIADVRLNNKGQLAGYTKEKDFVFFLSLFDIKHVHWYDFSPTKELRNNYHSDWDFEKYRFKYLDLIGKRKSVENIDASLIRTKHVCLLCSEHKPDKCHRRIAAEAISAFYNDINIIHL
jgi:uncharacterized protein (DUF488 family)